MNIFIAYDHQMTTVQVFMNGLMVADKNMVTNIMGASGNAMAIYYKASGGTIKQTELPIYGASRLGVYMKSSNAKNYQITDHLGNVRAVAQRAVGSNIVTTLSYADYYPFGEQLQGRSSASNYRYAYQGQEKDGETGLEAFQLRMWDGRLGRWLSPDPYGQYASPYLGMGNDPVNGIDPDGGWKYRWQAWLYGLIDGKDGKIFKSKEKGDFGIEYREIVNNENILTLNFGGKRYNNNGYTSVTNVFNSGGINSNSVPCVKCHHDAIFSFPSLPNINLDFLKPSSGYIMYGANRRGSMDFGRSRGPGGEIYGTMDTQDLLTPGGFNGGGGTLLKQWLHLNNILPEASRGVKHVTSSLSNLNSLNEKLNGETIYDTVYYLHSFKNQVNRYEVFKGIQKTDSFIKKEPSYEIYGKNVFKRD